MTSALWMPELAKWQERDERDQAAYDAGRAAADLIAPHIAAVLRDLPREDVTAWLRAEVAKAAQARTEIQEAI